MILQVGVLTILFSLRLENEATALRVGGERLELAAPLIAVLDTGTTGRSCFDPPHVGGWGPDLGIVGKTVRRIPAKSRPLARK